jgi:hypothetical protein
MKTCRKCGVELVSGGNWYQSQMKISNYICNACMNDELKGRYGECYIRSAVCRILRDHSDELKDDPERLSTEFILSMVNDRGKDDRDV